MNIKRPKNEEIARTLAILSHPIRIDILKLVYAEPRSFSDLLTHLSIESSGKLSFHLEKLSPFINKNDLGFYEVTKSGVEVYVLLDAFEKSELTTPATLESKIQVFRNKEIKTDMLLIMIMGFLSFINLVTILVTRYFSIISLFGSIGIFIIFCYKMNIPFDTTRLGSFLLFVLIVTLTWPFSVAFFPLSMIISTYSGGLGSNSLSITYILLNFDLLLLFLIIALLFFLIEYLSDYFGWSWSLSVDNGIFRGPRWLLAFKNRKFWLICLFTYIGLILIWGSSIYMLEFQTEQFIAPLPFFYGPLGILLALFIPGFIGSEMVYGPVILPALFYLPFNSIIISITIIYFLSKANKLSSEVNSAISLLIIMITPFCTIIFNLWTLSSFPEANTQSMINLFLISQFTTAFFQLIGIIGITLLALIFLSKIEEIPNKMK